MERQAAEIDLLNAQTHKTRIEGRAIPYNKPDPNVQTS